ncbi:unnamed protein product [Mesocestoides corti]|uniref:Uncharacterized protein n=1 Tax=Mesocestoides corti TaxID=53468 RepID=A0A0R3UNM2_MESCO|nr:unnamed protein product [Mesocestoides corti]
MQESMKNHEDIALREGDLFSEPNCRSLQIHLYGIQLWQLPISPLLPGQHPRPRLSLYLRPASDVHAWHLGAGNLIDRMTLLKEAGGTTRILLPTPTDTIGS